MVTSHCLPLAPSTTHPSDLLYELPLPELLISPLWDVWSCFAFKTRCCLKCPCDLRRPPAVPCQVVAVLSPRTSALTSLLPGPRGAQRPLLQQGQVARLPLSLKLRLQGGPSQVLMLEVVATVLWDQMGPKARCTPAAQSGGSQYPPLSCLCQERGPCSSR